LGEKISPQTIRRTLHQLGYAFKRPRLWAGPLGEEPDELLKAKEAVKKGDGVLIYQDETSFRLLPLLRKMWQKVGEQVRILTPVGWNKYFTLFGALDSATGRLIWRIFDKANSENFISLLEDLLLIYPKGKIYLVLDRATYHKSKKVKEWLKGNPRLILIYLPARSPQMNPIEPIWRWLKGRVAANRCYEGVEELKEVCRNCLSSLSEEDALRVSGLAA